MKDQEDKLKYGFNFPSYILLTTGLSLAAFVMGPYFPVSTAFIHDNLSKKTSSTYLGLFNATFPIGSIFALSLSALLISKFRVDFSLPEDGESERLDWIGAWWLGYAIFSPILLFAPIVLCFFPKKFQKAEQKSRDEKKKKRKFRLVTIISKIGCSL